MHSFYCSNTVGVLWAAVDVVHIIYQTLYQVPYRYNRIIAVRSKCALHCRIVGFVDRTSCVVVCKFIKVCGCPKLVDRFV